MGRGVPLGEVGPVAFLLRLVEVRVEVDHVLREEALPQFAGLQFLGGVPAFEFPVLLLPDVPPDLRRHALTK